ncbi:hypothetical protein PNEG_03050 [Pneumocystis murina B123]|uniref:Uncharacterized protein n=1 Tax=Pneumocystis murina (strain B123) TaxID=1069680 RepID=M7NIZ0_PNEMU|nr:hypothetical protein PNEG_03050 [Pneumocystis murina B123]EMR08573.1 hypothetical protein PNEG_03050 [Pneumocystis murina B123]
MLFNLTILFNNILMNKRFVVVANHDFKLSKYLFCQFYGKKKTYSTLSSINLFIGCLLTGYKILILIRHSFNFFIIFIFKKKQYFYLNAVLYENAFVFLLLLVNSYKYFNIG